MSLAAVTCGRGNRLPPPYSKPRPFRIIRTPAQRYALVIGLALTAAGIIGFFYSAAFGKPGKVDDVFGVLDVNGWHNLVHLLTGLLGLAVWRSYSASRKYAIGFGAIYGAIAIWGLVIGNGESILGIIPVNTEDNVLHLLIGVAGVGAAYAAPAAEPATPAPQT